MLLKTSIAGFFYKTDLNYPVLSFWRDFLLTKSIRPNKKEFRQMTINVLNISWKSKSTEADSV